MKPTIMTLLALTIPVGIAIFINLWDERARWQLVSIVGLLIPSAVAINEYRNGVQLAPLVFFLGMGLVWWIVSLGNRGLCARRDVFSSR